MKRVSARRGLRRFREFHLPLRRMVLAAFFLLGIFGGYIFALRSSGVIGEELARYWEHILSLPLPPDGALAAETLFCYWRGASAVLLLGFSFAGVVLLPVLCAAQAFLYSFCLFSFASALERDAFCVLLIFFAIRFLLLPLTYSVAAEAMDRSVDLALLSFGRGKRVRPVCYDFAYWLHFCVVFVCLLMAAAGELFLFPRLLQMLII